MNLTHLNQLKGVFAIVVQSETIIQKMMDELVKAKGQQDNKEQMTRHIENVQLLCDLLLIGDPPAKSMGVPNASREEISEQEMKTMIIGQQTKNKQMKLEQIDSLRKKSELDDEHSSGDSLFDF